MKKKMPRHDEQFSAMMQVIYLMDAAYAIYRATYDEDPVTPEEVSIALGWHPGEQKWVSNQPDVTKARENLESMLDDCWLNRVAPLQTAFKDILTLAKQRLDETDWRPCRCARCREE